MLFEIHTGNYIMILKLAFYDPLVLELQGTSQNRAI